MLSSSWRPAGSLSQQKGNQTADYLIVIGTLLMVGVYAVLVGRLLPKH